MESVQLWECSLRLRAIDPENALKTNNHKHAPAAWPGVGTLACQLHCLQDPLHSDQTGSQNTRCAVKDTVPGLGCVRLRTVRLHLH